MTKEEAAALLNGREYPLEITRAETATLHAAGLVVVYGASDDLTEWDGAIRDETGNGPQYLTSAGLFQSECECDDCPHEARRRDGATVIKTDYTGDGWYATTTIPHVTFDVAEDGDLYGRGIVFALADVA